MDFRGVVWKRVWKMTFVWSEIGSGFGEPRGTPPQRIPRSNPPPPPGDFSQIQWIKRLTLTGSPSYHFVVQSFIWWIVLKVLAAIQFRSILPVLRWVKTIATWKTVIESMQSLGMDNFRVAFTRFLAFYSDNPSGLRKKRNGNAG